MSLVPPSPHSLRTGNSGRGLSAKLQGGRGQKGDWSNQLVPLQVVKELGHWEPLEGKGHIKDNGWEGEKRRLRRWKREGRLELGQVENLVKGARSEEEEQLQG